MKKQSQAHTFGFSLIEILIVLAIVAILTSLAFTSWKRQYSKLQFANSIQVITTELYRARSEARKSSQNITVAWNKQSNLLTVRGEDNTIIRTLTLPEKSITIETESSEITYLAPYGTVLQNDDQYIRLSDSKNNIRDILIIGITGKIYQNEL